MIREFSNRVFVPFYRDYLSRNQVTNSIYAPGGPPSKGYIRHSTFDVNDGRQSFGILNSLSFIQEGLNGTDNFKIRLEQRAKGQETGMMALLEFVAQHHSSIRKMVAGERENLVSAQTKTVAIQLEHVANGDILQMPVHSYKSETDTLLKVVNYRPVVKALAEVTKPLAYLIPKNNVGLTEWCKRQNLNTSAYKPSRKHRIEQYRVSAFDTIDFEGDVVVIPEVESSVIQSGIRPADYLLVPCKQLKGTLLVIALEPCSPIGLMTYPAFAGLLRQGENYPVLRVLTK